MKQLVIKQFNGGIADSLRENSANKFGLAKNFDIFKDANRLIPFRNFIDADANNTLKDYLVQDFLYTTNSRLYFFGRKPTTNLTKIFRKTDVTSATIATVSTEGDGVFIQGSPVEYKSYIWGFQGSNEVWKLSLDGTTLTQSAGTVSGSFSVNSVVPRGVIAADDNLYMAYSNSIVRVDSTGTVTDGVLTIPSNLTITSLENYGNYLAIAATGGSLKDSFVYLWDLVSDDVTETINWGKGDLKVLSNIDGYLVGVSNKLGDSPLGLSSGSLLIKAFDGSRPQIIKEVFAIGGLITLTNYKVTNNNVLYFYSKIAREGSTYNEGLWAFGRKNSQDAFALNLALSDSVMSSFVGFYGFGNYFIYGHNSGDVRQTNYQETYTEPAVYESQELYDESGKDMSIKSLKVCFDLMPSGGQLVGKFRKNGETSWTTLFTHTTASSLNKEYAFTVPANCSYFQVRVESTGGLIPKMIIINYETLNSIV